MSTKYEFLNPAFLEAMNDIGRYGAEKYGEHSFDQRIKRGDFSRDERSSPVAISCHAGGHFDDYLFGVPHDKFNTLGHQIAASAFNCMAEYCLAKLDKEV